MATIYAYILMIDSNLIESSTIKRNFPNSYSTAIPRCNKRSTNLNVSKCKRISSAYFLLPNRVNGSVFDVLSILSRMVFLRLVKLRERCRNVSKTKPRKFSTRMPNVRRFYLDL